ncbi:GtrA family protein [Citrobacter portucalensis]|uniref:GtrA family protein n=1 Tax=Citrobacter portucalensis TaxID=1639133 RepID=UPI001BA4723E|nr:GtrA family protein [Citrobacter portucalensis]
MLKLFTKYMSIGVINTIIHWLVFGIVLNALNTTQALANLTAFCTAVTFSFYANAKFTFKAKTTNMRFILYIGFMGTLSAVTGLVGDACRLPALLTLICFSFISLICGFLYSKFIVFRSEKA